MSMMEAFTSVAASFFGSLGFAILYNTRGRRVLIPAVGGAFFWAVYLVLYQVLNNEYMGFFLVAMLCSIYAEIWARILKTPATTVLITTVIPLIPGGALYYTMDAALREDAAIFIDKGKHAIGLALALAAGIMVVSSLRMPVARACQSVMHRIKSEKTCKNS